MAYVDSLACDAIRPQILEGTLRWWRDDQGVGRTEPNAFWKFNVNFDRGTEELANRLERRKSVNENARTILGDSYRTIQAFAQELKEKKENDYERTKVSLAVLETILNELRPDNTA